MYRKQGLSLLLAAAAALWCPAHPGSATSATPTVFVEPDSGASPILSLIRRARHSLRLEVYLLDNRAIIDALGAARSRGVDVRVILEERPYGAIRYARLGYSELQAAGVPVRWANESRFTYTHAKSMEIDGQTAGIFTLNLSGSGLSANREFGVIDPNPGDARAIAAIVDGDWARVRPHYSSSDLVVSPYNSRSAFDNMIDSAHRTLDLYAEEVNDAGIQNRLASAVRRHVRVRLITSASSSGVTAIERAGVSVHLMRAPYVHAKAIVADGTRTFIGSENISTTSLDHNREIGIMLGSGAARAIEAVFSGDWARSGTGAVPVSPPPPPPAPSRGAFRVNVAVEPRTVRRDDLLTVSAATRPGASCSVQVTYPDGYVSRSRALSEIHVAGSSGTVSWSYHTASRATGTSTAVVTCRLGSRSATGTATFVITS